MPKLLDITEVRLDWNDLNNRVEHVRPAVKRSRGVHVSGVLKYVAEELKILKPRAEDEIDEMPMVAAAGFAMEGLLAGLYADMHWQPGELRYKGIIGSPDGINTIEFYKRILKIIEEFKLTYKSLRTRGGDAILNEWLWMEQIKTYLNLLNFVLGLTGAAALTVARLHVWFACGDYQYPLKPRYMRYLIEFSAGELANNWAMMMRFKNNAAKE